MATKVWDGSTDGDFGTAANWTPSGVPTTADDVYFVSGSVDVTGSDQSSIALASVTVGPNYTGTIGSSGQSLILDTNTFKYDGRGTAAFISLENGTAAAAIDCDVFGTKQTTTPTSEGLHLTTNSTDVLNPLRIHGGYVTVADSTRVGDVYVMARDGSPTVDLGASLTVTGNLNVLGGNVTTSTGFAAVNVMGGKVTQDTGTTTTVNVYGGQMFYTSPETITTLNVYRGSFDSTDNVNAWTVTNTNIYDGTVDFRANLNQPTMSNPPLLAGRGSLYADPGTVTITYPT